MSVTLSTKHFDWDSKPRTLSVCANDLLNLKGLSSTPFPFRLTLISQWSKKSKDVTMVCEAKDFEGDITYWMYQPADNSFCVMIWNN